MVVNGIFGLCYGNWWSNIFINCYGIGSVVFIVSKGSCDDVIVWFRNWNFFGVCVKIVWFVLVVFYIGFFCYGNGNWRGVIGYFFRSGLFKFDGG